MARTHRYNDPESRREFWKDVCDHISQGYSMKSYPRADEDTIYSYAKKFPEDCPIAELDEAKRKSCLFWEKIGLAGATGKVEGFNAASWIFNMKNRFNWTDKHQVSGDKEAPIFHKHDHEIKHKILKAIPQEELERIMREAEGGV